MVSGALNQAADSITPTGNPTSESKFCDNCGAVLLSGSAFCDNRGASVAAANSCPKCGMIFTRAGKFCPKCGFKRGD